MFAANLLRIFLSTRDFFSSLLHPLSFFFLAFIPHQSPSAVSYHLRLMFFAFWPSYMRRKYALIYYIQYTYVIFVHMRRARGGKKKILLWNDTSLTLWRAYLHLRRRSIFHPRDIVDFINRVWKIFYFISSSVVRPSLILPRRSTSITRYFYFYYYNYICIFFSSEEDYISVRKFK